MHDNNKVSPLTSYYDAGARLGQTVESGRGMSTGEDRQRPDLADNTEEP
jgi:hypothetical protein